MSARLRALGHWAPEVAIAALLALCVNAVVDRDPATFVMSVLSFVGVIAVRLAGARRVSLLVLSIGLIGLIFTIDSGAFGHARAFTSAAHLVVGALLAWVIAAPVKARLERARSPDAQPWVAVVIVLVLGAAMIWEAGEWAGDVIFGASLQLSVIDSELDVMFAVLGALAGALAFRRWHFSDGRPRAMRPAA